MIGKKMCGVHKLAAFLVIVGALNWGLVGVAKFDLVAFIFGNSWMTTLVYILVGVSGLMMIVAGRCCLGKCPGNCPDGACSSGTCHSGTCQPAGGSCSTGAPKKEVPPTPVPDKK
jgi:hypothetical protein